MQQIVNVSGVIALGLLALLLSKSFGYPFLKSVSFSMCYLIAGVKNGGVTSIKWYKAPLFLGEIYWWFLTSPPKRIEHDCFVWSGIFSFKTFRAENENT